MTRLFSLLLFSASCFLVLGPKSVNAQTDQAVVRGKIVYDKSRTKSWEGHELVIPYQEIVAKLRERVTPPAPPFPSGFQNWKQPDKLNWGKKFIESAAGKKFLENRTKLLEKANSFDIKFEKDGAFVIYDVPPAIYEIQGRIDKEIGDTLYGFEVFGQIEVLKGVDVLALEPMRVEVTPLMKRKQDAPPIAVKTHDDKKTLTLETFKDRYLFVNFWTSQSPTAVQEQTLVQEMYTALKEKHPLKLLSINVDEDRKKALKYIIGNRLKEGSYGFTNGFEHQTIFDYGVRSFPSFWLIGQDGKILMTQYEVAQAMRVKPDITTIVSDRIEGKDEPTPAEAKKDDAEGEK